MKLNVPVVGILRGIAPDLFGDVMQASFEGGLQAIEVTMNTKRAEQIVAANRLAVPSGKLLGMGTIRNIDEAKKAADSGAMFFVTPNLDLSVIQYAVDRHIPVIAGALTPTEVYNAWSAGATMVKVFPCRAFGPRYIKDLLGPFDKIPLVAVGGVSVSNVGQFFKAGASAVGVGTSLFGREALAEKDMQRVSQNVKKFIEYCKEDMY
ncbi:MAG: bifunctional 4-hydroxy-2-oxoglutarate aldolase/2-dehydro-3-deoxy-phosphogluconate aldolase [Deltaproteobacteria bacterium]|nr:bifunctional 4-hydroxy-2-oxoglutarate aldolase/2-dehydro-3-deoxy-phosphogluconate aldolase [Deltaproteobacteria bacterium]